MNHEVADYVVILRHERKSRRHSGWYARDGL
jgi:hypothetical protein